MACDFSNIELSQNVVESGQAHLVARLECRHGLEWRAAIFSALVLCSLVLPAISSVEGVARTPEQAPPIDNATCVGGKPTAPIKIEVFSDFQCPACREFYLHTIRPVLTGYADAGKVCVVYHEFPLTIHQHAREAARYGHAAQRLGQRYWVQVADALYSSQDQWSQDGKIEPVVAGALSKEDMARLRKEMADPAIDAAITSDINLAKSLDINQTPTSFVTTKDKTEKVAGVVQYPIMRRYLDYYLAH